MNLYEHAEKIEKAALGVSFIDLYILVAWGDERLQTIAEGKTITGDLGGKANTQEFTGAIMKRLHA